MSNSPSSPPSKNPPPLSLKEFEDLVKNIEQFYALGDRLSQAIEEQPSEYLIQESSLAFTKSLMSLIGFLRFIPSSQFFAKEGECIVDLSSASVMGRQVLEDTLAFLYLSEPNLTDEQKLFRKQVWQFHGYTEAIESAEFADPEDPDLPLKREILEKARALLEENPLLAEVESNLRGRIRAGDKNQVVYDAAILDQRGIMTRRYDLPRKALSNFAHFSDLSHKMIMETSGDWQKCWYAFFLPSLSVAAFIAEGLQVFVETFPQTASLLTDKEQQLIEYYRGWLRDKRTQPK
jgi:hypothetical protein